MDLEDWSIRLKVFADATRVRLLALLELEELTVAELSSVTHALPSRACPPTLPSSRKPAWSATAAPACRPTTASTTPRSTPPSARCGRR